MSTMSKMVPSMTASKAWADQRGDRDPRQRVTVAGKWKRPSDRAGTAELVNRPLRLGLGDAVALLQCADKLLATAVDDVKIVVGEFAPLFAHTTFKLLPVALELIPVHGDLLVVRF